MKAILLLLVSFVLTTATAQNQLILQLHQDEKVTSIIEAHQYFKEKNTQLHFKKQLSKTLNISLLEFDPARIDPQDLLAAIQKHPAVKYAQFNAPLSYRAVPDDALFSEQWQYANNGASGTFDADIDAPEAWDITTGGTTITGDEIVVAVLDGGVNLQHPDLAGNIWTNAQEIPDNNIDDDNNGYIDDYYGWNFNEDNKDISNGAAGHWHGTPVAGIIGAKGNNGIGVSGVNWNIKLMNIAANQMVADIIAAYDYVLQMRKKYNDTNGAEGAFIVATNASLGINNGNPTDHPLWCEMYNQLGQEGIISVAATANAEVDVDIEGDLPTTCGSDFLISVTNTTNTDNKAFGAAYGASHIDLGAPGAGTFTIDNSGDYSDFGGTSAASPHVTGAVALLYAAPVTDFMQEAKQSPEQTALLVKDFILNGPDPISDLENRSVTGGRLNLYNSLLKLQEHYGLIEVVEILRPISISEVHPNPTTDKVNIQFKLNARTHLAVEVYNTLGQQVGQRTTVKANKGLHQINLPFGGLPKGVYVVHLTAYNIGGYATVRIVVH